MIDCRCTSQLLIGGHADVFYLVSIEIPFHFSISCNPLFLIAIMSMYNALCIQKDAYKIEDQNGGDVTCQKSTLIYRRVRFDIVGSITAKNIWHSYVPGLFEYFSTANPGLLTENISFNAHTHSCLPSPS